MRSSTALAASRSPASLTTVAPPERREVRVRVMRGPPGSAGPEAAAVHAHRCADTPTIAAGAEARLVRCGRLLQLSRDARRRRASSTRTYAATPCARPSATVTLLLRSPG